MRVAEAGLPVLGAALGDVAERCRACRHPLRERVEPLEALRGHSQRQQPRVRERDVQRVVRRISSQLSLNVTRARTPPATSVRAIGSVTAANTKRAKVVP